jgi:hypothetical protein
MVMKKIVNKLFYMKYCVLCIVFLCTINNVWGNQFTENYDSSVAGNAVNSNTITVIDTSTSILNTDSIERGYNIMLYLYRLQIDQMERMNFRDRRIIFILGLLIAILLFIIIRLTTRKALFSSFPYYRQKKGSQPGMVCLQMMHKYYYGKKISYKKLQRLVQTESDLNSMSVDDLAYIAEKIGFDVKVVKADLQQLNQEIQFPAILYMPNHMTVLYAHKNEYFHLADPYYGYLKLKLYYFATTWIDDDKNMKGIAIQLFPMKQAKRSTLRKLDPEKFSNLRSLDKRSWKNYTCVMDTSGQENA